MVDSKKGNLPMNPGISLSKQMSPKTDEERTRMTSIPYASAVGSLMYAMLCTRPDIAYALSVVSRFQSDPGENHWIAVKNILKYLKRTKELFLILRAMTSKYRHIQTQVSRVILMTTNLPQDLCLPSEEER